MYVVYCSTAVLAILGMQAETALLDIQSVYVTMVTIWDAFKTAKTKSKLKPKLVRNVTPILHLMT